MFKLKSKLKWNVTLVGLAAATLVIASSNRAQAQAACVAGVYATITNRLATLESPTNAEERAQRRVLLQSKAILERPARNTSAELRALGLLAVTLHQRFADDVEITNGLAGAESCYHDDIVARLNALSTRVGNLVPSGLQRAASNQVVHVGTEVSRAETNGNVAIASRRLATALVAIDVGNRLAGQAELAPGSLSGRTFVVMTQSPREDRDTDVVTFADTTYSIPAHRDQAAETGAYTYTLTASNAGTLVLTPDGGGAGTTVELLFNSKHTGRFTATSGTETMTGHFRLR